MNKLDQFEESLRTSIEGFEVPYNSSDWSKLVERMDDKKGSGAGTGLYVAFLAGALLLGGTLYYALNNESGSSNDMLSEQVITDSNTIEATQPESTLPQVENDPVNSKNGAVLSSSEVESPSLATNVKSPGLEYPKNIRSEAVVEEKPVVTNDGKKSSIKSIDGMGANKETVNDDVADKGASTESDGEGELGFYTSLDESCSGTTISFQLDKVKDGVIYLWNFGDGSFSNKPEPEHVYERAGSYAVTLSMTSQSGGPIENKLATEKIEIYDAPTAAFVYAARDEVKKLPYIHFENNSRSAVKWEWDFGDGSKSVESHPDHLYRKAGTYPVTLTVTNAKGCVDQLSIAVAVTKDNNLKAPKTFSPNGDGMKDTFMPEALKELNAPFRLSVYETTGGLVYSSNDTKKPWNGVGPSGTDLMPAGDYVWVVDFLDGLYKGESFQGQVSLLH